MIAVYGKRETRRHRRHHGTVLTVLFLLALPVLLATLFFAVNIASLAEAKATLQNNADADALAAAQCLVDDSWLTFHLDQRMNLLGLARVQAQLYAAKNKVLGKPLTLQIPAMATANPADGDIVFAFLDKPRSPIPDERVLVVHDLDAFYNNGGIFSFIVNTVRIHAHRTRERGTAIGLWGSSFTGYGSVDATCRATATLDRDVIGFRPVGDQPVPLVPIALLTRAVLGSPSSWENELLKGNDNWKFDPASGTFSAGADYLPEATMVLNADETQASALLLLLDVPDVVGLIPQSVFAGQVAAGVSASDLQGMGGTFVLSQSSNRLAVAATRGGADFYAALASDLNQIQGQKRVWPLYESFSTGSGQAVIAGFIAARVVQASAAANGVTIILQPCMLSTRTAITDAEQRGVGGVNITNRYICRVRLVE